MLKRLFPTLAEWGAEKWIALPAVLYLVVGTLTALAQEAMWQLNRGSIVNVIEWAILVVMLAAAVLFFVGLLKLRVHRYYRDKN